MIIIKVLTTIFLFLCLASSANSAVLSADFITEQVKQGILEQVKQQHDGKIEIEITGLPYSAIEIPDGNLEIKAETDLKNIQSTIVKVKIYVNNEQVKYFGVRVDIKLYDKVWVAKSWIKRGETLKNLVLEEKEITSRLNEIPEKNFEPGNYLARRNIKPGEVIDFKYIEEVPTIVKDSPVSLIFKTPSTSVTIPAIAVTSGKTGDYIKVKNKEYGKNYVGKIIGKNIVLVNI